MERKSKHDRSNSGVSRFLHKALNISQDKKTDIPKTASKRVSAPSSSKLAFIKSKFQPLPNFTLADEPTGENKTPATKAIKRHQKSKTPKPAKLLRRPIRIPTLELPQDVVERERENEEWILRRNSDNSSATNEETCITIRRVSIKDSLSEQSCGTMRIINPGNMSGNPIATSSSGEVEIPKQHDVTAKWSTEDRILAKQLAESEKYVKVRPPIPPIYLLNKKYFSQHKGKVESLAYIVHAYEAFMDTPGSGVTEQMMKAITDHLNEGNYAENYKRWHDELNKASVEFHNGDWNLKKVTRQALKWFDEQFAPPQ